MIEISNLSLGQLLKLHPEIEGELRRRKIIRTANKPTGDYAELLFLTAFPRWKPAGKAQRGFDAIGPEGRYQIKGRRIIGKGSRQLSAIRDLKDNHFDFLAGVLFNKDYSVDRVLIMPRAFILSLADKKTHISYQRHTRSHLFQLVNEIWKVDGVKNVTNKLVNAEKLCNQRYRGEPL
ncbi:MAG TPA: hypothetical protein VMQ56_17800 [Terracidiphilus sp.]|jgi:hypothetical protein|nr:hypothetical protein [Terracidiphilus sp.]